MEIRIKKITALVWISVYLVACAGNKTSVLPQDGPTMKALYDAHMHNMDQPDQVQKSQRQLPQAGFDHYVGFMREAANEIDTIFPRLPNPILIMYIYPHLSGTERTPVPGYVTTFPLYETTEYALPGEAMLKVAPLSLVKDALVPEKN